MGLWLTTLIWVLGLLLTLALAALGFAVGNMALAVTAAAVGAAMSNPTLADARRLLAKRGDTR